MEPLQKPQKLQSGDKVAAVSLSWGGAGEASILWRYNVGKSRLQNEFGLQVIELPHTLMPAAYVYQHPKERAEDLMAAFSDPTIKGIFSCIGGDDSIRLLPYIDFEVIRNNPKPFIGYSDSTVTHMMCLKAGIGSFYGPSILAEFAENVRMNDYIRDSVEKTLFHGEPIGMIPDAPQWTVEFLKWTEDNQHTEKKMQKNSGTEWLQGSGKVRGRLIGGCLDALEFMKGTALWPEKNVWDDTILFFETSEDAPPPIYLEYWLRNYGAQGILQNARAILWGKPYQEKYYEEYKEAIRKIVVHELGLKTLPMLYNMSFGHNQPMMCLPYGAMAEIDCESSSFTILESGVK